MLIDKAGTNRGREPAAGTGRPIFQVRRSTPPTSTCCAMRSSRSWGGRRWTSLKGRCWTWSWQHPWKCTSMQVCRCLAARVPPRISLVVDGQIPDRIPLRIDPTYVLMEPVSGWLAGGQSAHSYGVRSWRHDRMSQRRCIVSAVIRRAQRAPVASHTYRRYSLSRLALDW